MAINVIQLLEDYNIEYTTTHHHCTPGWVNVHCPFCPGKPNFHLGIHLETQACHCWRCGSHNFVAVVSALLSVRLGEAKKIIESYITSTELISVVRRRKLIKTERKEIVLPVGLLDDLTEVQKKYLRSRKFDVEQLKFLWGIKGIGPVGPYRYRIFIPITYQGKIVSYQGRAVAKEVHPRYKTCKKEDEIIHYKYMLYGIDHVVSDSVIVVEGVTDVWRLGPGSVAVFGVNYSLMQVIMLSSFSKVYVMFDDEPAALRRAKKLAYEIQLLGNNDVYIVSGYGALDPGDLSAEQAHEIRMKLLGE